MAKRQGSGVWLPPGGVSPGYYKPAAGAEIVLGSSGSFVRFSGSLETEASLLVKNDYHTEAYGTQLGEGEAGSGDILY